MQWACLTSCCFQRVMTVSDRRCCRHNSAVVRSPRRAARETFALNSGLNFLGFAMTGYLLSYRVSPLIRAPSFWGAVQLPRKYSHRGGSHRRMSGRIVRTGWILTVFAFIRYLQLLGVVINPFAGDACRLVSQAWTVLRPPVATLRLGQSCVRTIPWTVGTWNRPTVSVRLDSRWNESS